MSDLKVAILTTETSHHVAFVRGIVAKYPNVKVFEEKRPISAKFDTQHEYDDLRDKYELDFWFDGKMPKLSDFAPTETYENMNAPECIESLREYEPDAIVVFGTGRLDEALYSVRPDRIVNLHGADPEQYRGLDTHLWALYHGDFDGLVTSLHRVDPEKDRGGVVMKMPIPLHKNMKFYELRRANCEICIEMVLYALDMLGRYDQFISQPQRYVGRHYSFMPAILKDRCVQKFYGHTLMLPD